ncbi:MAG: DUF2249 domain-containing protein [Saprospirales bacterium]|jgi:uncharacterized protein (DUF2249 family)|nr:DUF2249 domain-containing protein [Saprospirales bacterium]MBK8922960.1 DUF2249 domain-containing protein [Saprospirales bacterium]
MTINANTKIAALLKQHPDALEAIVSISPKFAKLRNPILRKVIASRASIATAAQLGGCTVDDFFNKLQPLGFEIDLIAATTEEDNEKRPVPEFLKNAEQYNMVELDVRPVIESGKDPLNSILQKVKSMNTGDALKIINSFEPTPLMYLLGNQGFESYSEKIDAELVYTYFYKKIDSALEFDAQRASGSDGWDEIMNRFKNRLKSVDVRALEMPLPMRTILEALETLPADKALFVYHKRIPVFLLPELEERKFSYRIKEIGDSEVHLLIYSD